MIRARCRSLISLLCVFAVLACGGGGGGGSGSAGDSSGTGGTSLNPATDFFLVGAALARPIFAPDGGLLSSSPLVNPASLQEIDPLTGIPLPGFPKPLNPGTLLSSLATLNLEQVLDKITPQIPLAPRNAALVLEFTKPIDRDTLNLDDSEAGQPGRITTSSTVQVRDKSGAVVPARAFVLGSRLALVGVTGTTLGFEASPLFFDQMGTAIEDPEGHLRVLLNVASETFASTEGAVHKYRDDRLGAEDQPLPFNPGNAFLDAILLQTEAGAEGFNGFLPDLAAPRIVRPVSFPAPPLPAGAISTITSVPTPDGLAVQIEDLTPPSLPNITANAGLGEWAGGLLTITSPGGLVTKRVVETNFNVGGTAVFRLAAGDTLPTEVGGGDEYELFRTEFFEPVPGPLPSDPDELARVTVDPVAAPRDPDDPQDVFNSDLRYFVRVFDDAGVERLDAWNPSTSSFLALPPRSTLQLQFSEPMDPVSFLPYETFYVTEGDVPRSDPAFDDMRLGSVESDAEGSILRFKPALIYPQEEGDPVEEYLGFGGTPASLSLVLRTIPSASVLAALEDSLSSDNLAKLRDLADLGVRGITDLGGRGLGLPLAILDEGDPANFLLNETSVAFGAFAPALDFRMDFQTEPSSDPDYGVIVHRFLGQATSALFVPPDTGDPVDTVTEGIEYNDYPAIENAQGDVVRRFIYGPRLLEVGLGVPGRLTGASATTIEHLIDNFNPPAQGSFSNPNSNDFLISLGFGLSMPLNSPFGARMQQVYRATDASPSKTDFAGVTLDLVGLAWTPFNNSITNTQLDGMSLAVGLSGANRGLGPNTNSQGGIPVQNGDTGLRSQFDCNWLEYNDACYSCTTPGAVVDGLAPFVELQAEHTRVIKRGTPYQILQANLFKPSSAGTQASGFNLYLDFPNFNAGIDPVFNRKDIFSFPYDSRFPMLLDFRIEPNVTPPSRFNFFRFSPGILTSVLPRFRTWSQGQDPLAHCIPNFTQGLLGPVGIPIPGNSGQPQGKDLRGGEGGPLLEPGTFPLDVVPPKPNNGMPAIPAVAEYPLPPREPKLNCSSGTQVNNQPVSGNPQAFVLNTNPMDMDPNEGCLITMPTCRIDPNTNWYYASGMLAYPLPNTTAYPGQSAVQPTFYLGYGHPASAAESDPTSENDCIIPLALAGSSQATVAQNEPGMAAAPAKWGDNSRYYMMWKYRKRVSLVESPTIQIPLESDQSVVFLRPVVEPPLFTVSVKANLKLEVRAGPRIDFAQPAFDSGYVDVTSETFTEDVSGNGIFPRDFVKFRASFGVAPGEVLSPALDTMIIPYMKVTDS